MAFIPSTWDLCWRLYYSAGVRRLPVGSCVGCRCFASARKGNEMGREVKLLTGSDFFHGDAPTNSEERKGGIITTCACLAFAVELPMTICKKSLVAGVCTGAPCRNRTPCSRVIAVCYGGMPRRGLLTPCSRVRLATTLYRY